MYIAVSERAGGLRNREARSTALLRNHEIIVGGKVGGHIGLDMVQPWHGRHPVDVCCIEKTQVRARPGKYMLRNSPADFLSLPPSSV